MLLVQAASQQTTLQRYCTHMRLSNTDGFLLRCKDVWDHAVASTRKRVVHMLRVAFCYLSANT
jgi:hypothetical protein